MLCASSLRPVAAIARAKPLSLAGHRSLRATALSDHAKPGTYMLGGKGALATRGQRITLLPPANAAPAGDESGGGQSGPPAQEAGPNFFSETYTKEDIKFMLKCMLPGLLPIAANLYYIAGLYFVFVLYVSLVTPLLYRRR